MARNINKSQQRTKNTKSITSTPTPTASATQTLVPLAAHTIQRAQSDPSRLSPSEVVTLQRTMGNTTVSRMLDKQSHASQSSASGSTIQRAMKVGPADDRYEREADHVANSVLGASSNTMHQTSAAASSVQREPIGPEGGQLNGDLESRLKSTQNSGSPLPNNVRGAIEPKLGADLSQVKVHTDSAAVQMNQEMGAKAFTHQNHIYYGKGHSPNDVKLTAHEATHTIQQGAVEQVQTKRTGVRDEVPMVQRAFTKRGKRKAKIRKEGNWNRKPTSVAASSGGVRGGAVFVNFPDESYVLKTSGDESPARALFAEKMLAKVGGLDTPDSVPIEKGTPTHTQILKMLDDYEFENRMTWMQSPKIYQKFKMGVQGLRDGQYILVMKNLAKDGGGKGLGDELDTHDEVKGDMGARNILLDRNSQERIGITMAIDFALGNADRFEEMNLDNVFQMASGNLGAIDNDAILPKMPNQDKFGDNNENAGWQIEKWVARVVRGEKKQGKMGWAPANSSINDRTKAKDYNLALTGQPLARMKMRLSDFDKWFDDMFRGKLEMTQGVKFSDDPQQNTEIWNRIKVGIQAGLQKGLRRVESSLKGRKGRGLKSSFKKYGKQYQLNGMKERNYDWEALQVRQRFIAAMNKGLDADKAEHEALKYAVSLFGLHLNDPE